MQCNIVFKTNLVQFFNIDGRVNIEDFCPKWCKESVVDNGKDRNSFPFSMSDSNLDSSGLITASILVKRFYQKLTDFLAAALISDNPELRFIILSFPLSIVARSKDSPCKARFRIKITISTIFGQEFPGMVQTNMALSSFNKRNTQIMPHCT